MSAAKNALTELNAPFNSNKIIVRGHHLSPQKMKVTVSTGRPGSRNHEANSINLLVQTATEWTNDTSRSDQRLIFTDKRLRAFRR